MPITNKKEVPHISICLLAVMARTYLQTPLRLPEFFPIGQWNLFKYTEVRHLTDPLALKLVRNGSILNGVLNGVRNGVVMLFSLITEPFVL